jgi:3-oxoacyl-(acyl-carrier-protein) synthase
MPVGLAPDPDLLPRLRVPKNIKYMTRNLQMAVSSALEAVDASELRSAAIEPERVGIYTGSGQTGLDYQEFYRSLDFAWGDGKEYDFRYFGGKASRLIDPYFSLRTLSNAGVALIAAETGFRGPSANFVQSETAAVSAIEAACYDLIEERCDAVIAGGYDSLVQPGNLHAFGGRGLIARSEVKPFDRERNGLAPGEGAAFFVLERMTDAINRNADILAELIAVETATDSIGTGSRDALASVIDSALGSGADISWVVARGIGTEEDDRQEAESLHRAFSRSVPVTALKGYTGYLGAATAAAELALTFLTAKEGFIPPIAGLTEPDSDTVDWIVGERRHFGSGPAAGLWLSSSWVGPVSAVIAGVHPK